MIELAGIYLWEKVCREVKGHGHPGKVVPMGLIMQLSVNPIFIHIRMLFNRIINPADYG